MVLVFKLVFFASSETALCATDELNNGGIQNFKSAREVASYADEKLQLGDLQSAEYSFSRTLPKFSTSASFQYEYISFMLKIGQYDRILSLSSVEGETNRKLVENARNYKKIIENNILTEVCSLLSVSPNSLQVNIAMAKSFILQNKPSQAKTYLNFGLKLYPSSSDLLFLKSYLLLADRRYQDALDALKHSHKLEEENDTKGVNNSYRSSFFLKLRNLILTFENYSKIEHPSNKIQSFNALFRDISLSRSAFDEESINLFDPLYKHTVEVIVKTGCDSSRGVEVFARILKRLEPSEENIFYYIKSLVLENRIEEAKKEYSSNKLSEAMSRYLSSFIKLREDALEKQAEENRERQEAERREQQRRQRQQQQQQYSGYETKNAGKDFLNYYNALGVDKNATLPDLKKAHRKKIRIASKKGTPEKQDEELKKVNKAFQILSDEKKKKAYDMGIDPETGPQPGYHSRGGHQHFDEETIQDVFRSFFGSSGGQQQQRRGGRGGYQRAQFIFL